MPVDDQLCMGGVEVVPERLHGRRGRGRGRRGRVETRVVPQREYALLGGGREVGLEPGLLRRARGCRDEARVAVQHDDVPGAQVVAVVSLGGVACGRPEVAEVSGRRGARVVVVIAGHGVGARLVAAPAQIVTGLLVCGRPAWIGGVAYDQGASLVPGSANVAFSAKGAPVVTVWLGPAFTVGVALAIVTVVVTGALAAPRASVTVSVAV